MIRGVCLSRGHRDYLSPKLRNTARHDNAVSNQYRWVTDDIESDPIDLTLLIASVIKANGGSIDLHFR